eukprot:213828_1
MATQGMYHQFDAAEKRIKKQEKIKTALIAFVIGSLLSILIFWGIQTVINKDNKSSTSCNFKSTNYISQPTNKQSDALSDIHQIFFNTTWRSQTMNNDDKDTIQDAYDTFDDDNDGKWSYYEFITYQSFLSNYTIFFNIIDTDNDSIVSIRELVAHFLNVGGVGKFILNNQMENRVYDRYGLDERNISRKSKKFNQYIANIWFADFDKYGKGYFNLTDFQYMFYNRSFKRFDDNKDNFISFSEFFDFQFHESRINKPSAAFLLFKNTLIGNISYADNNGKIEIAQLYKLKAYDHMDVSNINFSVSCPITEYNGNTVINDAVINRRRLSCVGSGLACAGGALATGASCTAGEVASFGTDTAICAGSAVGTAGACYDAYGDCFGSDDSSSNTGSSSSGSYSDYSSAASYGGYYGGYY